MKLDVIISADDIKDKYLENKIAVVIDVLRATTVITTALNNGCRRVVPFLTVDEAIAYADNSKEDCILGGERKAIKIPSFHFSNSPLEYTKEMVKDKTLVITTTNGTRAIEGCRDASRTFIGAMVNARAVTKLLSELDRDVVFVNAGTYGQFSMDDFITCGYMIHLLNTESEHALTDIAYTAKYIYESNKDITGYIKNAFHYGTLKALGLEEDLEYSFKKDIIDLVPEYKKGVITGFKL